jgi:glycosyltransferase involved in cell wall biosynthesis
LGEGDKAALFRIAEILGFSERLSIASTDDVYDYYLSADMYVSTSYSESFGLANLEALCAGLPSLLSSVGGVPEVAGTGGWLINCNDESMSSAISSLIDSAQLRSFWRKQATDRVASWPSRKDIASQYVSIYS